MDMVEVVVDRVLDKKTKRLTEVLVVEEVVVEAGLPAGDAGEAGLRQSGEADEVANGSDGGNATTFENGEGGGGGNNADEAFGGSGGRGGDEGESAQDGGGGSPSDGSASGSAGADGGAIRAATGSISFEIINSSGVIGSTSGTGVE